MGLLVISCKYNSNENIANFVKPRTIALIEIGPNAIAFDSSLVLNYSNQKLLEFYRATGFTTVWQSQKDRAIVLETIANSYQEGLFPEDYQLALLQSLEAKYSMLQNSGLVEYDILLTIYTQHLLLDLKTGKLDPRKLYTNWDIFKTPFDVNSRLIEAFNQKSLLELMQNCRPIAPVYSQLKEALRLIEQYPDVDFTPISFAELIVPNDTNPKIITVKKRLRYWGDITASGNKSPFYDAKTVAAVKRFQERHGLAPDGIIGAGTIEALNFTKSRRKKQIIANLERWRWFEELPNEDYISINIPDYKLIVVENQDTTLVQKVVVGTSKRKTPILTSYLKTVVLNPTWTIPPTILKEDVLPAMKKNRQYLLNKDILIYDSNNNIVPPESWNPNKPNQYKYIQKPGPNNTLGEMKILFPNHHSIYLHDTNHRNLFGLYNRSLSSGCIRVEKPLELAGYFLNHSENWSKTKIDSIVATRKTHYVKIEKKYNLYLWYWTAWSHKGKLYFRKDIYDYDTALYDKLRS